MKNYNTNWSLKVSLGFIYFLIWKRMIKQTSVVVGIIALSTALFATPVLAGYTCTGAVRGISLDAQNGDLLAESIGSVSWPRLCSFRSAANGVQPDDCKRMYAALLTAQASGKTITFWVNDSSTACATLTPWAYVNGLYFLRLDS